MKSNRKFSSKCTRTRAGVTVRIAEDLFQNDPSANEFLIARLDEKARPKPKTGAENRISNIQCSMQTYIHTEKYPGRREGYKYHFGQASSVYSIFTRVSLHIISGRDNDLAAANDWQFIKFRWNATREYRTPSCVDFDRFWSTKKQGDFVVPSILPLPPLPSLSSTLFQTAHTLRLSRVLLSTYN